jgi:fumarate reductase flavoprotein subunit
MKKAGVLIVLLTLLALCACSRGVEFSVKETLDLNAVSIEQGGPYVPGTYTATEQGYGGSVTVTMTFDESVITSIDVFGENETRNVGTKAIQELAPMVLEAQSPEVDAVSGATVTSDAIKKAVQDCIGQAIGD